MKTLFIDCSMGVAGDMLTAALAGATSDIKAVEAELNALGIPGVEYKVEETVKKGVTGTSVSVMVNGEEEEPGDDHHHHDHDNHDHDHDHHHDHDHDHDH
ncbi:MAG: DUF111 family protein, partial [Firmicutes bacterium]|nr:DUF111 family protein [Bacillota bacterium]